MADAAAQEEMRRSFEVAVDSLRRMVQEEPCVMFSTTVCPWCYRAADFLAELGRRCRKVELDSPRDDKQQQMLGMAVAMATKQRTVPNIFVKGKHVGGFDTLVGVYEKCKRGEMESEHADVCGFFTE
eukprot:CAMPEP_0117568928 /NCGR_PEP_ID=MMETSP0784-20121206/58395_1 /TAXON_ID=39447 /ORGANISM="" /LENGTH=126 /DNA_ID=CAMNT_0005366885 /DNA_START=6 /DNA_END=386 /DNA_ORIENTATION=-